MTKSDSQNLVAMVFAWHSLPILKWRLENSMSDLGTAIMQRVLAY